MVGATGKEVKQIPKSIWTLGIVSLLMDTSSEFIHSLLPIFMTTVLGASLTSVGVVEGISEATVMITRIFSGTLSDYFGKRKLLTVIGYGFSAFTKPLFPLSNGIGMVLTARFLDRIGKGIRGPPRDALIGSLAPEKSLGACFGLRQSLDSVGAFAGPLLAIISMLFFYQDIRKALWVAVLPAFFSVALLILGVKEPKMQKNVIQSRRFRLTDIGQVKKSFWQVVAIGSILSLARFSQAFLIIKAQTIGVDNSWVPMVMVLMNIIYSFTAYPAGILFDRVNRKTLLMIGMVFLIFADFTFAFTQSIWSLALGISFWGLHLGFTQGILAAMVTDTTSSHLRGTAYGIFYLMSGIALLLANIIAGALWDDFGADITFLAGTGLSCIALFYLALTKIK